MVNNTKINFLFPLVTLIVLIHCFTTQIFKMPPLGKILCPFNGVFNNSNKKYLEIKDDNLINVGTLATTYIYFDKRKVPHIFAKNDEDLFFAQGYICASLRLWQMDFLSYVSAGRLSEIFDDEKFLIHDRLQRRQGYLEAAENSLKLIEKSPEVNKMLDAYTKGVNSYIENLNYSELPLEYKIFDYQPEKWTKLKSILILKLMAADLSGYEEDLELTNLILALGENKFNMLFPEFLPNSTSLFSDSLLSKKSSTFFLKKPDYLNFSFINSNSVLSKSQFNSHIGSNSWAVSGKKTKSGFPILCSDPHLRFSLPSTWIEMQIVCPDINTYGVTIPGIPSIIIGFNENIAWGITNGCVDVKDWYRLKISTDYKKYKLDDKWVNLKYRCEKIKRKYNIDFIDTIYSTIHGPIIYNRKFLIRYEYRHLALRWELNNPSNELLAYLKINKSKNYKEFSDAIKYNKCPVLNFVYADKNNEIGINFQGNIPIKWSGQGKFILDGTKRSCLYNNNIPYDSLPNIKNPNSEFVYSANQKPFYSNFSYYINGCFDEHRANGIQKELEIYNDFDIEKMKRLQLNNTNFTALDILPFLIKCLNHENMSSEGNNILAEIKRWNGRYEFKDKSAIFYELWWQNINNYTWDEMDNYLFNCIKPNDIILADLIKKDPDNIFFDNIETSKKENASEIIKKAFNDAVISYNHLKKNNNIEWQEHNKVELTHLTNIPALSILEVRSQGNSNAINAVSKNVGPSWRMIVELGNKPKGYGIYPGGQSGNMNSPYYNNFTLDWSKGIYYPLLFFMNTSEAKNESTNVWILN